MITPAVPLDVLAALGRLNSHARAHGCGKDAIYAYKSAAVETLAEAKQISGRLVEWTGKCNRCDGTGIFKDWSWPRDDGVPCRNCSKRGRVTLQFLETTLPDGQVWHHPWNVNRVGFVGWGLARAIFGSCEWESGPNYGNYFALDITDSGPVKRRLPWHPVETWSPNSPGENLVGEAAADLLNLVEGWVSSVPRDVSWLVRHAQEKIQDYSLHLGGIGQACHYCGGVTASGQGHARRLLSWGIPVCVEHQGMPLKEWDNEAPASAFTPAIEAWLRRRGWKPGDRLLRCGEEMERAA